MSSSTGEITGLLNAIKRGDQDAKEVFADAIYDEMHSLAARYMRRERSDHTLQPSALVNETYLRLLRGEPEFQDRTHFFSTAATVMRRVLVDHARQRGAAKRHFGDHKVELREVFASVAPHIEELLMLDEALDRLAQWDSRQARVVELIYFGGLNEQEVATVLGVCVKTVRRDWISARAWLQTQLRG